MANDEMNARDNAARRGFWIQIHAYTDSFHETFQAIEIDRLSFAELQAHDLMAVLHHMSVKKLDQLGSELAKSCTLTPPQELAEAHGLIIELADYQ